MAGKVPEKDEVRKKNRNEVKDSLRNAVKREEKRKNHWDVEGETSQVFGGRLATKEVGGYRPRRMRVRSWRELISGYPVALFGHIG